MAIFIRMVLPEIDSSSDKSQTSKITLHSGETSDYLHGGILKIEVKDNGAGMTKDQLNNLFKAVLPILVVISQSR